MFGNKQKLQLFVDLETKRELSFASHSTSNILLHSVFAKYNCMPCLYLSQKLAVRAMVLHGEQLHRVPLGGRVRLHPHGALHRPLHRHRLPAQAKNVEGDCRNQTYSCQK